MLVRKVMFAALIGTLAVAAKPSQALPMSPIMYSASSDSRFSVNGVAHRFTLNAALTPSTKGIRALLLDNKQCCVGHINVMNAVSIDGKVSTIDGNGSYRGQAAKWFISLDGVSTTNYNLKIEVANPDGSNRRTLFNGRPSGWAVVSWSF